MDVPPEIAFRDVPATDTLKGLILDRIDRLETTYDHLVSCRVIVENTTPARTSGAIHRVHLELGVPGHNLIVNRKPPEEGKARDVEQAIDQAFDTARRRLKELKRKQSGDVKSHDLPTHGRVIKLLVDDTGVRYGFLMSGDGREIYFHENALVRLDYDDLDIGDEVRFAEAAGDEGPQASTVSPLDSRAVGRRQQKSSVPFGLDRRDHA